MKIGDFIKILTEVQEWHSDADIINDDGTQPVVITLHSKSIGGCIGCVITSAKREDLLSKAVFVTGGGKNGKRI